MDKYNRSEYNAMIFQIFFRIEQQLTGRLSHPHPTNPTFPSFVSQLEKLTVILHGDVRGELPNGLAGAGSDVLYNDTSMTLMLRLRNFL